MRSIPEVAVFAAPAAMPAAARALFGGGFFGSEAWFSVVLEAGLPPGARPCFVVVSLAGVPVGLFPMLREGRRCSSLATPYTCLWAPGLAAGLDAAAVGRVGAAFARWCRQWGVVRLDALDLADPVWGALLAGGARTLAFAHFGNWAQCGLSGWEAYLAGRPGQLREAIRRRGRRLGDAVLTVVDGPAGLDAGIAAYEAVYAKSWKTPEPFPRFNAALMRACAANGSLRLGVLSRGGAVLAVQFWVVREGWACVLKLAHDEAARAFSPGTVLTAMMIRRLIERDGVLDLDFGRGDDDYKQLWTDRRRERSGLLLVNPWHPAGAWEVVRDRVRRGFRSARQF